MKSSHHRHGICQGIAVLSVDAIFTIPQLVEYLPIMFHCLLFSFLFLFLSFFFFKSRFNNQSYPQEYSEWFIWDTLNNKFERIALKKTTSLVDLFYFCFLGSEIICLFCNAFYCERLLKSWQLSILSGLLMMLEHKIAWKECHMKKIEILFHYNFTKNQSIWKIFY